MIIGDCLIGDAPGAAGALHCTIDLIAANEIYIEPTCRDQLRFWKIYIILVLLNIVSESSYKNKMLREQNLISFGNNAIDIIEIYNHVSKPIERGRVIEVTKRQKAAAGTCSIAVGSDMRKDAVEHLPNLTKSGPIFTRSLFSLQPTKMLCTPAEQAISSG